LYARIFPDELSSGRFDVMGGAKKEDQPIIGREATAKSRQVFAVFRLNASVHRRVGRSNE